MYPPVNAWPLAYICLAPLALVAIHAKKTWHALTIIFVVDALLYGWLHRWTINVTQAGVFPLALCMALYPTLFAWIIRRIALHPRLGTWPMAVIVPIVWMGLEFLRCSIAFHGYPWFQLSHPIIEWPALAQSADLLGGYFSSFLVATVSGLIVDIYRTRKNQFPARRLVATTIIVLSVHGANIAYGFYRVKQSDCLSPGPVVLAIQTNLPQDNRNAWTPDMQERDVPGFMDLTRRGLAEADSKVDLIAWPETLVPGAGFEPDAIELLQRFGESGESYYRWSLAVEEFQRSLGIPMLVGATAWVDTQLREELIDDKRMIVAEPTKRFNSAYLLQSDAPIQRYDKYFLTPFGETMPYISNWPWLEEQFLAVGAQGMSFDLDAAEELRVLNLHIDRGDISIGTPICFEDCISRVIRRLVYDHGRKRADVLISLNNDGWFTWDDGGRAQRVQMARWRCVENRVPLVRSVNTGMSVHIDSLGRIIDKIGQGRYGEGNIDGWVLARTSLDSRRTFYGRIGDVWGWLCLAGVIALTIAALRRKPLDDDRCDGAADMTGDGDKV